MATTAEQPHISVNFGNRHLNNEESRLLQIAVTEACIKGIPLDINLMTQNLTHISIENTPTSNAPELTDLLGNIWSHNFNPKNDTPLLHPT